MRLRLQVYLVIEKEKNKTLKTNKQTKITFCFIIR